MSSIIYMRNEAASFCRIRLKVEHENGICINHMVDAEVHDLIGKLKKDISDKLGPARYQKWLYEGVHMDNNRDLSSYGIDSTDADVPEIIVRFLR